MDVNALENVEIAILEHVRRYRIGITRSCWSALRSRFPALTEQQTKGSLKELWLQKGLLRRETLLGTRQCYQLTRRYWQQHGDVGEIGRGVDLESHAVANCDPLHDRDDAVDEAS